MAPKYSQPTGFVFVRNFDISIYEQLGGYVDTVLDHPSARHRRGYWADILGASPMKVPLIFASPEQPLERKVYPSIVILREPPQSALERWHSVKHLEYVAGVSGTESVVNGVSGFEQVEVKRQAWPYDIVYTLQMFSRYEHEAMPMIKYVLTRFPPRGWVTPRDSLGENRKYNIFHEGGLQDIGELVDVADRTKSYAQAFRVECELDLEDPVLRGTVGTFETSVGVK